MNPQPDLFNFGTPERPSNPIEARFWQFHAENPHVYELFDRFTREVIARRRQHYSADAVLHRIRWFTSIETSGEEFKVNNNYSSLYARLWMRNNPQHAGFFATRELRAGPESDRLSGRAA